MRNRQAASIFATCRIRRRSRESSARGAGTTLQPAIVQESAFGNVTWVVARNDATARLVSRSPHWRDRKCWVPPVLGWRNECSLEKLPRSGVPFCVRSGSPFHPSNCGCWKKAANVGNRRVLFSCRTRIASTLIAISARDHWSSRRVLPLFTLTFVAARTAQDVTRSLLHPPLRQSMEAVELSRPAMRVCNAFSFVKHQSVRRSHLYQSDVCLWRAMTPRTLPSGTSCRSCSGIPG